MVYQSNQPPEHLPTGGCGTDAIRGRGTAINPVNRFEKIAVEPDPEYDRSADPKPKTEYFVDTAQSILSYNDSPDVGFNVGINPYRGCEHGCVYCFARPTHEYFGLSSGLDFETKIFVKTRAPELLAKELSAKKWKPQTVALSGNTDCYQPVERRLEITRRCLQVFAEFRNPVFIITKNHLVTRDIDVLQELAAHQAVCVFMSVTTLDYEVSGKMEPRASRPLERLEAIEKLRKAGIQVGVLVAPIIPALTDYEVPMIIKEAAARGAQFAGHVILRLPFAVKELFEQWLVVHFPQRKDKILNRVREIRGGKLNDPNFGSRMSGSGVFAQQIHGLFDMACKKAGIQDNEMILSTEHFAKPKGAQLTLFD
jgi:DNA repair photolyase